MGRMSKEKAIIIFTVAIDVIGLGIIIPVLPVYVESFGLSAFAVTMLFSIFSLFSFLSAPFLGALSDKIGRRPVLMISIASTSLGWFIFAMARSFPLLVLGRTIDGLAAGNFSTAQSSISDLSKDAKERAGNLGIIGMIFGLGFIVGPFIGGMLSKISHSAPFWFVGAMALINVILAYFFLPETNKNLDRERKIDWNPLKPLIAAAKNKKLRNLYIVWFLFNLIAVGANTVFALYIGKIYSFSPFQTGLFFTGIGLVLAVNQGFLLRKFWLRNFKEKQLIEMMLGVFAAGFALMSIQSIWIFGLGMVLTAFGQSTLGAAMTSEIMGEAEVKERGEAVGVLSSVASAANILAPVISGMAFQTMANLPYISASVLSIVTLVMIYRIKVSEKHNATTDELAEEVTA